MMSAMVSVMHNKNPNPKAAARLVHVDADGMATYTNYSDTCISQDGSGFDTRSVDMGNNEVATLGVMRDGDGWLALTYTKSKRFKAEAGARRWLARRGVSR
jgi:hypothetical protein